MSINRRIIMTSFTVFTKKIITITYLGDKVIGNHSIEKDYF